MELEENTMLRATHILWDIDYDDNGELPKEIDIPEGMTDEDEISDYLSDVTGYCHQGFELEEIAEDKEQSEIIINLWEAACSGDTDKLSEYYRNGGIPNRRYKAFGKFHSLIAGALRNGNFETVKYLLMQGETVNGEYERCELNTYYQQELIRAAKNLTNYYCCHNKNLTNKQYEFFDNLAEIVKIIK